MASRNIFGYRAQNRLNFSQSIHSKHSRLSEVVRYLSQFPYASKAALMTFAWKLPTSASRNTNSRFWKTAVETEMLVPFRVGNRVYYRLGPSAQFVKTYRAG
jgi:hypothetical protein